MVGGLFSDRPVEGWFRVNSAWYALLFPSRIKNSLFDAGSLTASLTEIVKLRSPHLSLAYTFDFCDLRRV